MLEVGPAFWGIFVFVMFSPEEGVPARSSQLCCDDSSQHFYRNIMSCRRSSREMEALGAWSEQADRRGLVCQRGSKQQQQPESGSIPLWGRCLGTFMP